MFLRYIFLKNLRDKRAAIFWWSLSFFLLAISVASIYPAVAETAADLEAYIESLPDAFKAAFALGDESIGSPVGYFNAEFFTFMAPIMFLIFAIGFGSATIAGEEEAGTLSMLLANPVPRWRVVIEKFVAMALGTAFLAVVLWLSLVVGVRAFDIDISQGRLAAATVSSALLGLSFGTVAFAVGAATGRRGLAVALAVVLTVVSYLLGIFAKIVESLESFEQFSLFYYAVDVNPLANGLKAGNVVVFIGVIAVALVAALVAFERRDLAV